MKKKMPARSLMVVCAVALVFAMSAVASADNGPPADPWQVRTILTPAAGVEPSFIAASGSRLAWTGAGGGDSRMFAFNLSTSVNATIPVTLPGSYYNPSADGPWIAYQGGRTGAYDDIYLYDTATGAVERITDNSAAGDWNDWDPRIQSDRIVWAKDMLGAEAKPGIYLYDISTKATTLLIAGDEYRNPDIWGNYVVCVKNAPNGSVLGTEIVLYNLTTQELRPIASSAKVNEHPRIAAGKIVWSSGDIGVAGIDPWPTYQINLYDVATGVTTPLTNNIAGNLNPSIDGEIVAWQTKLPIGGAIVAYDMTTKTSVQVSAQGDTIGYPDVDGSSITWLGTKGLYYAVRSSEATRFPDVPADHPYAVAIEGMAERQIIEGYGNGSFGPADLVTRQQFAKMIVLTMGYTVTEDDTYDFADASSMVQTTTELYPYHYVAKAALTGLTQGYPDGTFRPLNNITRQQMITMIVRAGSQFLMPPPADYRGVLSYADPTHGQNIWMAEYNHLADGIVGPKGGPAGWDTRANATRGEVAQMLWNLLAKILPAG
ncbi:MAG: S-layer homology domain-containing protein [bacterium]